MAGLLLPQAPSVPLCGRIRRTRSTLRAPRHRHAGKNAPGSRPLPAAAAPRALESAPWGLHCAAAGAFTAPTAAAPLPQLAVGAPTGPGRRVTGARRGIFSASAAAQWRPAAAAAAVAVAAGAAGPGGVQVAPELSEAGQGEEGSFVWDRAWYPICLAEDLDPKVPCAVTILGLPLVVWWDRAWGAGGGWRVFHDLCPHRLAPLSEGRIHESGDLQCSYHGWTFQGNGACSRIPQQDPDRPQACTSKKACARVYPSRVHQGIVWFWPQLDTTAAPALAEATPIPTVPELDDPSFFYVMRQADIGYGHELLMENLLDPAHVPFAHHSLNNQGKREDGRSLDFCVKAIAQWGLEAEGLEFATYKYEAPCLITWTTNTGRARKSRMDHKQRQMQGGPGSTESTPPQTFAEKAQAFEAASSDKRVVVAFWCIPRGPGLSRLISTFAFNFLPDSARKVPRWYTHMGQMDVLESDHYLLHTLERRLQEEGGQEQAMKAYYAPTRSDALVSAYRDWLKTRAGGQVQWPSSVDPRLPPALPKERLMDRMENHVKICKSCAKAVEWMECITAALQVLAFLSLAVLVLKSALQPGRVGAWFSVLSCLFSGFCVGASYLLSRFVKKHFYFWDYIHALVP